MNVTVTKPRVLRLRHSTPPQPGGCRWCGVPRTDHCQLWVPGHGVHGWEPPTQAQILARMRAQRAEFTRAIEIMRRGARARA